MAPIPTIGDKPAVWANSHHLVLFRDREPDDDRLQAGKAFIRFLTEQSAAWSGAGMIPARNEARETPEFTDSPQAALAPAIPAMRFLPSVPGVPDVQAQTLETAVSEADPRPARARRRPQRCRRPGDPAAAGQPRQVRAVTR